MLRKLVLQSFTTTVLLDVFLVYPLCSFPLITSVFGIIIIVNWY